MTLRKDYPRFIKMTLIQIMVLAMVQGAAELLPVSSSAHVIIAEKLMGLNPTTPAMTLLLVMLHTGTMFAVIVYFSKSWKTSFFNSRREFLNTAKVLALATAMTGVVGLALIELIEKIFLGNIPHAQIELIFGNMTIISTALAAAGLIIIYAGFKNGSVKEKPLCTKRSCLIGLIQGLCLPFRGFSRSGSTISAGLLLGVTKTKAEEFSFALAVVLTPPVIVREVMRMLKMHAISTSHSAEFLANFYPSLLGMLFSFISGLLALRWLSRWLERGRWQFFGFYCLFASVIVFLLNENGC